MKVGKSKLVAVFAAIGLSAAKKWPEDKLLAKAQKLEKLKEPDTEIKDKELAGLYDDLVAAVSKGKDIVIEDDEEDDDEDEKDEAPAKAESNGKATKKGKTPPKSAGGDKGPGVIASILEFLMGASEKKPLSKDGLVEKLAKRFPDREKDSMMATINVQVPNRIKADKEIYVQKNGEGYWIEGDGKKEGKNPAGRSEKAAKATKKDKKKAKAAAADDDED